jgi:predicted 3-demethylubiquinone-9 3-methyltransferase (glyoxalase superfamily)
MQKIVPFLWFDHQAEEAANFYVSLFKNSRVTNIRRYGEAGPGPKGSVMSASFELEGQQFIALNGGPMYHFTPAISLFVNCETQQEVDHLWEKLSAGGRADRCGWVTDRRPLLADHSHHARQGAGGPRSAEGAARNEGDAADDQDRYRDSAASVNARRFGAVDHAKIHQ